MDVSSVPSILGQVRCRGLSLNGREESAVARLKTEVSCCPLPSAPRRWDRVPRAEADGETRRPAQAAAPKRARARTRKTPKRFGCLSTAAPQ